LKKTSFIEAASKERWVLLRNLPVEVVSGASRVSNNEYQPAQVVLASIPVVYYWGRVMLSGAAYRYHSGDKILKLFFEDLSVGFTVNVGPYSLGSSEMAQFARQWDPQPFHVENASHTEFTSGQIASGLHTMAATFRAFVVAGIFTGNIVLGLGYDKVHLRRPIQPDDVLRAKAVITTMRSSKSRPNLGILKWRIEAKNADIPVLKQ
jgi:acyl dehydratase